VRKIFFFKNRLELASLCFALKQKLPNRSEAKKTKKRKNAKDSKKSEKSEKK
jgi:hypothetical protein